METNEQFILNDLYLFPFKYFLLLYNKENVLHII